MVWTRVLRLSVKCSPISHCHQWILIAITSDKTVETVPSVLQFYAIIHHQQTSTNRPLPSPCNVVLDWSTAALFHYNSLGIGYFWFLAALLTDLYSRETCLLYLLISLSIKISIKIEINESDIYLLILFFFSYPVPYSIHWADYNTHYITSKCRRSQHLEIDQVKYHLKTDLQCKKRRLILIKLQQTLDPIHLFYKTKENLSLRGFLVLWFWLPLA